MSAGLAPSERVFFAGNCPHTDPLQRIAAAAQAGFTATSLFTTDLQRLSADGMSDEAIATAIADCGLRLLSLETIGHWLPGQADRATSLPLGLREMLLAATPEHICKRARTLGADSVLVIDLFETPLDAPAVAKNLAQICDIAADYDLDVSLEMIPQSCAGNLKRAREIVERTDRGRCGILLDSWHFFRSGSALDELAQLPAGLIAAWQVSDAAGQPQTEDLYTAMSTRLLPGEGAFDLRGFMQALAATGTRAPGGIEAFVAQDRGLGVAEIATKSAVAMKYVLDLSQGGKA